jgi:hypothetical protein
MGVEIEQTLNLSLQPNDLDACMTTPQPLIQDTFDMPN